MEKTFYLVTFFFLFFTCYDYSTCYATARGVTKQLNGLEREFKTAMKGRVSSNQRRPLGSRKLPDEDIECGSLDCVRLYNADEVDNCNREYGCGICVFTTGNIGGGKCTDFNCEDMLCANDPNRCTEIGCGVCDLNTNYCLPQTCEETSCFFNPSKCNDIGCGECDDDTKLCKPQTCNEMPCGTNPHICAVNDCGFCDPIINFCRPSCDEISCESDPYICVVKGCGPCDPDTNFCTLTCENLSCATNPDICFDNQCGPCDPSTDRSIPQMCGIKPCDPNDDKCRRKGCGDCNMFGL